MKQPPITLAGSPPTTIVLYRHVHQESSSPYKTAPFYIGFAYPAGSKKSSTWLYTLKEGKLVRSTEHAHQDWYFDLPITEESGSSQMLWVGMVCGHNNSAAILKESSIYLFVDRQLTHKLDAIRVAMAGTIPTREEMEMV